MEASWLTQREFDSWRQGDTEFKQQMREYIETQSALNLSTERRLTLIEAARISVEAARVMTASAEVMSADSGLSKTRIGVISSLVSAAISGLVTALLQKHGG